MGIDLVDIDAEEVIIRTEDEDLVFTDAEVQRMDAQGQQTYQIVGEPDHRERGESGESEAESEAESESEPASDVDDQDVQIVAQRAGVSESDARDALEATDGDLAAAVSKLE
jgi:nascent polypeptide-associated complex subunit alpha